MIRKKKQHQQHENHERWLVSYADFITLLFAFFVVMYATSTNNVEKQKEFENSVRANLHLVSVSVGQGGRGDSKEATVATGIESELSENTLSNPVDKIAPKQEEGYPKQGSPREIKDYLMRRFAKNPNGINTSNLNQIKHEWYGVRMSLAASTFFDPGSYKLKLSSLKIIDEIVSQLDGPSSKIIIEGHTDNIPIKTASIESNWELSSLRASSVVRYLIKYHHWEPSKITAAAYADTKPIVPNNTEENRAKNRRIDFLIISDKKLNQEGY
ncbi:MAG: OmpA family protein [Bdellovibrionaceae bacterium]|nr:OmpA family protein [Pseudobdellovibrionaceae bacterium]